ncbi:(Fe-S)-binding protein [Myxococcota bacterium]
MINAIVMSVFLVAGLVVFAVLIIPRFRLVGAVRREKCDCGWQLGARIGSMLKFAFAQWRMPRDPIAGFAHIFIFFGFLAVSIATVLHFVHAYAPDFHLPGIVGNGYALIKDIFELLVTIAVIYSMWRRLKPTPSRVGRSWEGVFVLFMILLLMITDFVITGGELVVANPTAPDGMPYMPAGHVAGLALAPLGPDAAHIIGVVSWWIHCIAILVFLNFLPIGKHFHVITAIPNVFFRNLRGPGALKKVDVEKLIEEEKPVGIRSAVDLSWNMVLNAYSCTECGRCNVYCPTHLTDKPLSHRQLNLDFKHALYAAKDDILSGDKDKLEALPALVDGKITADTIWACTTCGSCEQECPVLIEQIPRIVGMRQFKAMMEGDISPELARAFEGMERNNNPWGLGFDQRDAWAKDLDIPRMADVAGEGKETPLLYWVGCAGSFDDRIKKVTLAMVKILKAAGIEFAILGQEEGCTGDSARRAGNEYLFQMMAQANVELLNGYKVKKILTTCPHCYHTFKVDYPDFGGSYEVVHHTTFIDELIRSGKLKLGGEVKTRVAWHDSCYLGRYHSIYDAPRSVVTAVPGASIAELPRNKSRGVCCGAGGGRFWMEENIGERINVHRSKEAVAAGTDCVGTACPFCLTMLKDGVADLGKDEEVKTLDLAELVAQAL